MDPVRYLTNASSGAMGFAVAEAFQRKGANVTVVSGPTSLTAPKKIHVISVETALAMHAQVKKILKKTDVFVATAAVSDFRFDKISASKLKKGKRSTWTVRLAKNPDILFEAGKWKKKSKSSLRLVGFALETGNIPRAMATKMREKNLDLIIGNTPASFSRSLIRPLWLEKSGKVERLARMKKSVLAQKIVRWAYGT
jgi:phosphopantothenoylcysteine decarboxylase/phosphopantothenate--cysteine ligase